ncbi:MAG: septal ring lytic transglycosylase RlpA family protein [Ginsengibacter sp.]
MKPVLLVLLFLSLFINNSAAQKKIKSKQPIAAKKGAVRYGIASYYAKKFDKRKTANGEIYRAKKNSAACNVLPLNTWIRVTNLRNNKSIIVKINDRLHPKNKRLVDLSWSAAKELRYISRGLTRVKVEVLKNFHPVE